MKAATPDNRTESLLVMDPREGTLTGPRGTAHLEPKVMEVLQVLAQHSGRVVSRDELLDAVWADLVVTDYTVSRCIYQLRNAFRTVADEDDGQEAIETLPKRGYRLRVEIRTPAGETGTAATVPAGRRWPWLALGLVVLGLAVGWLVWRAPAPDAPPSVAVLPFDHCDTPDDQPVGDPQMLAAGIADEVLMRLAEWPDLQVTSHSARLFNVTARRSAFAFGGREFEPERIAADLGVRYLLTGTVCREDGVLTVATQLVDDQAMLLWSERFQQRDDASGEITRTLAWSISHGLAVELGASEPAGQEPALDRVAYESYLIGREYRLRGDADRARAALELALERRPDFARAVFELALLELRGLSHQQGTGLRNARQIAENALLLAHRELEQDPGSAQAQLTVGVVTAVLSLWQRNLDWRDGSPPEGEDFEHRLMEAEDRLRAAIAINPSLSEGYLWLGITLEALDRQTDALAIFEQGLALDPFNMDLTARVAKRWAARGRFEDAIELLDRHQRLPEVPADAWWWKLELQTLQTHWDDKAKTLVDMLLTDPDAFESMDNRWQAWWFVSQLAELGLVEESRIWMERLASIPLRPWMREAVTRQVQHAFGTDEAAARKTRERLAGMTDDEVLDAFGEQGMAWVMDLAAAGELERAIELMESIQYAPAIWAERQADAPLMLARLYHRAGREESARPLLDALAESLEGQFSEGIRHPQVLAQLADVYALQQRDDLAIEMLRLAVDHHHRFPWWKERFPMQPSFARLEGDPRVAALRNRIELDLDRQAERVHQLLSEHDPDELLQPLMRQSSPKVQ